MKFAKDLIHTHQLWETDTKSSWLLIYVWQFDKRNLFSTESYYSSPAIANERK